MVCTHYTQASSKCQNLQMPENWKPPLPLLKTKQKNNQITPLFSPGWLHISETTKPTTCSIFFMIQYLDVDKNLVVHSENDLRITHTRVRHSCWLVWCGDMVNLGPGEAVEPVSHALVSFPKERCFINRKSLSSLDYPSPPPKKVINSPCCTLLLNPLHWLYIPGASFKCVHITTCVIK